MDSRGNHQLDLPIRLQVLNISVNMGRMGELVLKSGSSRTELLTRFLDQTNTYLNDLVYLKISNNFKPTLNKFQDEFKKLKNQKISEENRLIWAERAITWADILQIRSKLLT